MLCIVDPVVRVCSRIGEIIKQEEKIVQACACLNTADEGRRTFRADTEWWDRAPRELNGENPSGL